MDDLTPQLASHEEKPPRVDLNKLFLPGAILIAAVLVSATLLYVNKDGTGTAGTVSGAFGMADLKKWAKDIGLSSKKFNECLDSRRYQQEVQKDFSDGSALGVSGTPAFFINGEAVIGAQPYSVFQNVIEQKLKGAAFDATAMMDDDVVLGNPSATVSIIEFSDFQCPYCRTFWKDTLPSIRRDYINTGKVKFIYRDFPLSFHPGAQPMAEGAECAEEQGKYWEYHDKLFEEQQKRGSGTIQFSTN